MRDIKIFSIDDVGLDIDIIDGYPVLLDSLGQTGDQRAAICTYAVKGTVPGASSFGVNWAEQYTQQNTIVQLSNELQQQLQMYAGYADDTSAVGMDSRYSAQVLTYKGEVGAIVMRG